MQPVRIGIIGAGVIGSTHAAVLQQIAAAFPERAQLVAIADPSPEARERAAAAFAFPLLFPDGHRLLEEADVDAVFICTPTRFHAELFEHACKRCRAVFCEKPLAMSYAEGRTMVEAAERHGVQTQIGLVLRFSPIFQVLHSFLQDPALGLPMAVLFRDDQVFPIRGVHHTPWRADRTCSAGGTLIEHGVHDLDLLTWLFGPIRSLRAWERNLAGHPGIEDYLAVELLFESGLRAQLVNVWHDMVQRPSNRRLEVFYQRGFFSTEEDFLGPIVLQRGDGPLETLSETEVLHRFLQIRPAPNPALEPFFRIAYLVQDLAFLQALWDGRPPQPDLRSGLEAQRLAEAAYYAARTDSEVHLAGFVPETQSHR